VTASHILVWDKGYECMRGGTSFFFYIKNLFLNSNLYDKLGKGQTVVVKRIIFSLKLVIASIEKDRIN
jgi:hypothetical protein